MEIETDEWHMYPTDESLEALRTWPDADEALEAASEYCNRCGYGAAKIARGRYIFVTGGWSGCEDVIDALMANPVTEARFEMWHPGGQHEFRCE